MQKVRLTAETAYKKIQSLFSAPTDVSFGKYFQKQVDEFQIATKDFEREEIFQLFWIQLLPKRIPKNLLRIY